MTWGVFPGREIQQPTVVDPIAFESWKVGVIFPVNSYTHPMLAQYWASVVEDVPTVSQH